MERDTRLAGVAESFHAAVGRADRSGPGAAGTLTQSGGPLTLKGLFRSGVGAEVPLIRLRPKRAAKTAAQGSAGPGELRKGGKPRLDQDGDVR